MIDLHTHSTYSDGTLTPEQLLSKAVAAGLSAVALTDHNSVAGLPAFLAAGQGRGILTIPGTELSTEYLGIELHILGLFLPEASFPRVGELVAEMRLRKERSGRELVAALARAGLPMDYAAIKARTPDGYVNRALIAAEMVRLGYCESVKAAFARWLAPEHGYYTPPKRLDAFAAIRFLKEQGAAVVLAHPFLNLTEAQLRGFLPQAVAAGLDGMEVAYPLYDRQQSLLAASIAAEFSLLSSGGSDFHGANKPDIRLGTGRGELLTPDAWLAPLQKRARMADKCCQYKEM